jgi:hypothetical protein
VPISVVSQVSASLTLTMFDTQAAGARNFVLLTVLS